MHVIVPQSVYVKVFIWLAALMALTVAASQVNLEGWNVPVALAIAITKATLIVLFFMNVRHGSPLVRLFAASGFFWLLIMLTFIAADVLTRNWTG